MEFSKEVQTVRPLSQDFAFLALKAAVEVDNISHGRPTTKDAMVELAKSLLEATSAAGPGSQVFLNDPVSAELVNRAFEQTKIGPIDSLDALIQHAKKVASSLQQPPKNSGSDELQKLRNFCLALSQVTSSYRQQERETRRPKRPSQRF